MKTTEYRRRIEQLKGSRAVLEKSIGETSARLTEVERAIENSRQAQAIIHKVASDTQTQLRVQLGELGSLAQAAVFPDPYRFEVDFEISKTSGTRCTFGFHRRVGGEAIDPMRAAGGGTVDVASWALRFSILPIARTRLVAFLDEPFRFLSREFQPRAATIIREVSAKLGIQVIMITHSEDLIGAADKVFHVAQINGVSQVQEEIVNAPGQQLGSNSENRSDIRKTRSGDIAKNLLRNQGVSGAGGEVVLPDRGRLQRRRRG